MSAIRRFQKFAGKHIVINDDTHVYVPTEDQSDAMVSEAVESLHPRGALEAGHEIVAVMGLFEGGELTQMSGFVAINDHEDTAYKCDEGSIEAYDTAASKLDLEIDENAATPAGDDD